MTQQDSLATLITAIGKPDELEQDNRKGIAAIWGSRATGAFTVERGPISTHYEIVLLPVEDSAYEFEKHQFEAPALNEWFSANVAKIKAVLAGE